MEVCPNCGKSVDQLDEFTGWCENCSKPVVFNNPHVGYLAINANSLEHYIVTGQADNVSQAISILADPKNGHRPTCVVCGGVIKHGPRASVFCRKTKECRKYSRRYIYLYQKKGHTKTTALAIVLSELSQ